MCLDAAARGGLRHSHGPTHDWPPSARRHTAPVASASREPAFVLVHSPLVGPTSWLPVARELERRGRVAVIPSLLGVAEAPEPRWRHVPQAVHVATSHLQQQVVLVGHSGAGLLPPVIADSLAVEVAAMVFVDSRLPPPGGRLLLGAPEFMDQLRAMATDGLLPTWSRWFGVEMMRELVPDEGLRAELEAEMPRLPLSYFEAAVPLPGRVGKAVSMRLSAAERHCLRGERRRGAGVLVGPHRRAAAPGNRHEPGPSHRRAARPRTLPEQSTRSGRRNSVTLAAPRESKGLVRSGCCLSSIATARGDRA
jgi:hypothetical protein